MRAHIFPLHLFHLCRKRCSGTTVRKAKQAIFGQWIGELEVDKLWYVQSREAQYVLRVWEEKKKTFPQ